MALRNNHKTIRVSDEVLKILDKLPGETFADKFENMVLTWANDEKNLKLKLKNLEKEISDREKRLLVLSTKCQDLLNLSRDVEWMNSKLEGIKKQVEKIVTQ